MPGHASAGGLPVAYSAAELTVVPSIPTPRFREPWGLVCNEAMHQGRPVVATTAVGAAAGGLVRDGETGLVIAPGDTVALAAAISRLLEDEALRPAWEPPPARRQLRIRITRWPLRSAAPSKSRSP